MRMLSALIVILFAAVSARAFDSRDADNAFSAYNFSFYVVTNGMGFYKATTNGTCSTFWMWAEEIEMIEDTYERTHSPATRQMIEQSIAGFAHVHGTNWMWNKYNDDIMWMTIACERCYLITTNPFYRDIAKKNFDAMYSRAWDNALGGGLWWTTDNRGKHACINGPAAISACLLCQITGDKSYLEKAKAIYAWERGALFTPRGAVRDNMRADGTIGKKAFTYNEGTFIGAADLLWKFTGDTNYLSDALLAANFTRSFLSNDGNLPVYGNGDVAGFNGIFVRWMSHFATDDHLWPQFHGWLLGNANSAWQVRRSDNLSWQDWNSPTPDGTLNSWNCSSSVVVLQVIPPEQPK